MSNHTEPEVKPKTPRPAAKARAPKPVRARNPPIPTYDEMRPYLGHTVTVTVTSRGLAKRGDRGSKKRGTLVGYQRRGDGPGQRILYTQPPTHVGLTAFLNSDGGNATRQRADVCLVLIEEDGYARVHTPRVQHVQLPRLSRPK